MTIKFLDLALQYKKNKKAIDTAINRTIKKTNFIGGAIINNFEENFAKFIESKYCLGVANGTDALEIAIESLNLKKNSEIIVPSNSWISSSESITRNNCKVIFCDINKDTYTIDTKKILKLINRNTSAIVAVHLYGHPCEIDELIYIKNKFNLKLIEDCAQAHGAKYKKIHVGNFGDIATFSFYPGKNLGAYGDAGAITTNNHKLYLRCKKIANHGGLKKNVHEIEGRNSRLDTIQAAILSVKLKSLKKVISKRNQNAKIYFKNLKNNKKIILPKVAKNIIHAFHLFVIRVEKRNELINILKINNIEFGIHYPKALHKLKAYRYIKQDTKNFYSGKIDSKILSLPIHEHLNKSQILKICKIINKTLQ